jgi:hypothetical protein
MDLPVDPSAHSKTALYALPPLCFAPPRAGQCPRFARRRGCCRRREVPGGQSRRGPPRTQQRRTTRRFPSLGSYSQPLDLPLLMTLSLARAPPRGSRISLFFFTQLEPFPTRSFLSFPPFSWPLFLQSRRPLHLDRSSLLRYSSLTPFIPLPQPSSSNHFDILPPPATRPFASFSLSFPHSTPLPPPPLH